ncbi:hypothetical protein MVES1_003854 [Malassezia vespertilionis]|uniref:Uncharacterized protein n=1 Tax=Malassezia vespertilionis TaxID=2020962 RepID=A0A2N1J7S6_9BASI|nr:uncharacterized protein MVES1_003854 [Malassezia vespertilionis]PKI82599.1 hypothetical protein MVES_003411 [Malassezia vespertilionis]WFD08478.1 hypothetical protein MVES1_003854 [Malassezia vespertilionis]
MAQSTAHHKQSFLPDTAASDCMPRDVDARQLRALSEEDAEPAVRHLYIDWPSASIKGTFTIGANVPDMSPPLYDLPKPDVVQQNAASAVFHSRSSPVNVVVNVLHGAPTLDAPPFNDALRKSVFVKARSVRNSACVHVPIYVGRRPLHIRCSSTTGNGAYNPR